MSRIGSCARREAIILSVESDPITDSTALGAPNPDGTSVDWTEEAHPLQAGAPVLPESPTFAELGVRPEIVAALDRHATIPMDSLAYKFDIVLRGRRSTLFENRMEGN